MKRNEASGLFTKSSIILQRPLFPPVNDEGVFDEPSDDHRGEHPRAGRLFEEERGGGHAGGGIGVRDEDSAVRKIKAVDPAIGPKAQSPEGPDRFPFNRLRGLRRDALRRCEFTAAAGHVLVVVGEVVALRGDLRQLEGMGFSFLLQDDRGEFLPVEELLGEDGLVPLQCLLDALYEGRLVPYKGDADAGALARGLREQGEPESFAERLYRPRPIRPPRLLPDEDALGDADFRGLEDHLLDVLVHAEGRGHNAGSRVRKAEELEKTLETSVLSELPVQREEGEID